jgi:hypothetical protein
MKTLHISSPDLGLDFNRSMKLAAATASNLMGESMLLSWYDRERNYESPAHVSECHSHCATPGYIDFAANHGGELVVDFEQGRFVFCFRPLGEFAVEKVLAA